MLLSLLALNLFTLSCMGTRNVDINYAISAGVDEVGIAPEWTANTAFSLLDRGPLDEGLQLEITHTHGLGLSNDRHRSGIGLRKEWGADVAASAHVLQAHQDNTGGVGLEGALAWRLWQPESAQANDPTTLGLGLGMYVYGGGVPGFDEPFWWTGTGLQLSFGN